MGHETASGSPRYVVSPALLGDWRVRLLGSDPRARWIDNGGTSATGQPTVVVAVTPAVDAGRIDVHQLAHEFKRGPGLIGVDLDVARGVNQHRAERPE